MVHALVGKCLTRGGRLCRGGSAGECLGSRLDGLFRGITQGFNTIEANLKLGFKEDEREYSAVAFILQDLGVKKVKIITNNPKKMDFVEEAKIEIVERIPAITPVNSHNECYLKTKKEKMGHYLL